MMKKWLLLLLSTLLFWGCDDSTSDNKQEDKCAKVTCEANHVCDTSSGECKFDCSSCEDWEECNDESSACVIKAGHCDDANTCTDPLVCSNHVCVDPGDPCATVNCETWQYCDAGSCTLKSDRCESKDDCNDNEICDPDHNCKATTEVVEATINQLRTDTQSYLDKLVKTSGIITAVYKEGSNVKGFWMQEKSGTYEGLYIYLKTGSTNSYVAGDSVTVTGTYIIYAATSVHELYLEDDTTITKSGSSALPATETLELSLLGDAAKLLPYESMLVSISGNFVTTSINGDQIELSDGTYTLSMKGSLYEFPMDIDRGFSKMIGVLERNKNSFRLLPRSADDLTLIPFGCDIAHDGAGCYDWESCVDNKCELNSGACNAPEDCANDGATCENHACVGGTLTVQNGDFEIWDNGAPEGWVIGQDSQNKKITIAAVNSQISVPKLCQGDYDCTVGECNQSGDEQVKHTCIDETASLSPYSSATAVKVSRTSDIKSDEAEFLSPPIPYDPNKTYTFSYWLYDNDPNVTAVSYVRAFNNEAYNKVATIAPNNYSPNNTNWQQRTTKVQGFKYNGDFTESDIVYIRVGIRVLKQNTRDPYDDLEPTGIGSVYIDDVTIVAE